MYSGERGMKSVTMTIINPCKDSLYSNILIFVSPVFLLFHLFGDLGWETKTMLQVPKHKSESIH